MKKTVSLLLAILSIVILIVPMTTTVSAASTNAYNKISSSNYAKTYTIKTSGITIPYTNPNLTTRGTTTKASSGAYIDNASDELYVFSVGKNSNGVMYAYISYPTSSKRVYAYIRLTDIINTVTTSHNYSTAKGKFYLSTRSGYSLNSSYWCDAGDTVYLLSTTAVNGKYQIMAPRGAGGYRIAWCTVSDYNKYCANTTTSTTFSPAWPCKNSNYISTMYRYYNSGNPSNHGVRSNIYNAFDIAGSYGDTIYAVESGTVVDKGYQNNGFGYYVIIKHSNGLYSLYGHLKSSAIVNIGNYVSKKQVIGYMGSTGNSSGTHLHFEMYNPNNKSQIVNPWKTYYQGKVTVTIGENSYKANINYTNDSYAQAWCSWLRNNCSKLSNGDYRFYA